MALVDANVEAAGRRSRSTAPARRIGTQTVNVTLDETYDGDGQQVKEGMSTVSASTTYKLRSSRLVTNSEKEGSGLKS